MGHTVGDTFQSKEMQRDDHIPLNSYNQNVPATQHHPGKSVLFVYLRIVDSRFKIQDFHCINRTTQVAVLSWQKTGNIIQSKLVSADISMYQEG